VTLSGAHLRRRLDRLRREREAEMDAALARAQRDGEVDPRIRAAVTAIFAAAERAGPPRPVWADAGPVDAASLARRLARGVDGEAVETDAGWYVRRELRPVYLPLDRGRLAELPAMPPPAAPLLCLDTETTGLGSAAGTVAFLIGLARWEGERIRLLQLALPDHSEEPALLAALEAEIPPGAWLVTYNGRSFDWPLIETRLRMNRRRPPAVDGHLDLLLLVRRLFRHRLADARLQTVERALLRRHRAPDIPASEIPAVYHSFLRGGPVGPLRIVARHNAEDVVTLGRILAHLERGYAAAEVRRWAPCGDLVRLARLFRHEGRVEAALACLEDAGRGAESDDPDGALATVEMARLLRREGRTAEAALAWARLVTGDGPLAALGWIELAKEREHRQRDLAAAWAATDEALLTLYRNRDRGQTALRRDLEADLAVRRARLARRLERAGP
jgi:uncharacterized protein YprB with RNaseH-like and TPR domain